MEKIKIIHFHNGSGGGVLSVIRNLLLYRQSEIIENHVIYTVNKNKIPSCELPRLDGATSERIFYYSANWNFYHTCRELAKLLPDEKAVIVAHDWLELGMVNQLGLLNPVVYFLHGDYDYYYHLAVKHRCIIDEYISVSSSIESNLKTLLKDKHDYIHYSRFPIPKFEIQTKTKTIKHNLSLVFIGRLCIDKGIDVLPKIDAILKTNNLVADWHIAGTLEEKSIKSWLNASNVHYYGELSNKEVVKILLESDILILPSKAEGMPIVVIEAMKMGVVPIVSNLSGGIQELVIDSVTGYKINEQTNAAQYAEVILDLNKKPLFINQISEQAQVHATNLFNPDINTKNLELIFLKSCPKNKKIKPKKVYGSRLDHPFIPNWFVYTIRTLFKMFRLVKF